MADDESAPGKDTAQKSTASDDGSSGSVGWLSGLDTDTQELAKARGWDKGTGDEVLPKVVQSYRELSGKLGKSISVPADDAPPEEKERFFTAIGRPEKPEDYEFKLPDEYPEGLPYDKEFADNFRGVFHEAGVPKTMADKLHGAFALQMAAMAQANVEAVKTKVEGTHDALVKDWGPVESDTFKANKSYMDTAVDKLGLTEAFKANGIMLDDGSWTDPAVAQAMKTIGESMFKEDVLEGDATGGSGGGKNPWKADQLNTKEQGRLIQQAKAGSKADRQKVAKLIQAAGKNPYSYFEEGDL